MNDARAEQLRSFELALRAQIEAFASAIVARSEPSVRTALIEMGDIARRVAQLDRSDAPLSFSGALYALRAGKRVRRAGWNGKGMWLRLVPANSYFIQASSSWTASEPKLEPLPWIGMKTADNCFVPWLCSQTDALSEDWEIVP